MENIFKILRISVIRIHERRIQERVKNLVRYTLKKTKIFIESVYIL